MLARVDAELLRERVERNRPIVEFYREILDARRGHERDVRDAVEELLHARAGDLHDAGVALADADLEGALRILERIDELAVPALARCEVEARARLLLDLERRLILLDALVETAFLVGLEGLHHELDARGGGSALGRLGVVAARRRRRAGAGGVVELALHGRRRVGR